MRRFNFDDDDQEEVHEENFFEMEGEISKEEYVAMMQDQQILQQMQLEIAHKDLNQRLLFHAIKMCEKSFFWCFFSQRTQLRRIIKAYRMLTRLTEIGEPPEKEDA